MTVKYQPAEPKITYPWPGTHRQNSGISLKQPIRWLIQGLSVQTKEEKKFLSDTPLGVPTDDNALRVAIQALQDLDDMCDGDHLVKIAGIGTE